MNNISLIEDDSKKQPSIKYSNISHQRALDNCALALVEKYAKFQDGLYELSFYFLNLQDQSELLQLYIESIDRDIGEAITNNDKSIENNVICKVLAMLKDYNCETREDLAKTIYINIMTFYSRDLNMVLEKACEQYFLLQKNEQDSYSYQDLDSDDIYWS